MKSRDQDRHFVPRHAEAWQQEGEQGRDGRQYRSTARLSPPSAVLRRERSAASGPISATVIAGGVNFSLFPAPPTRADLLLFDTEDDATPTRVIPIDPATNRTYHYWHVLVPGIRPGQIYGYRVKGPSAPERGLRLDPDKVLLDPYGRGTVIPKNYDFEAAKQKGDNAATAMKSAWSSKSC